MGDTSQEFGTILGADAKFKGDLEFESAAKVLGTFEGSIQSKGKIMVAESAVCKANLTGKDVTVEGQIEGNVQAADRLEVNPTARIRGDVVAKKMAMAEGATIEGHMKIGVDSAMEIPRPSSGTNRIANGDTKVKETARVK